MYRHGGDIYNNKIELDFSVNINPFGTPFLVKKALKDYISYVDEYPQMQSDILLKKLGQALGISSSKLILTSGASEAFLAIVKALGLSKATVFYPSFYGYEYALNSAGTAIERVSFQELSEGTFKLSDHKTQALFIANPNNPDGKRVKKEVMEKIIKDALEAGVYLIADECFIELTGYREESLIYKNYPNVIVVRSFTKTFAMPGVRLGYIVLNDIKLKEMILSQLPEWNLSGFAIAAGLGALKSVDELDDARLLIAKERTNLSRRLSQLGFEVFSSEAPYIMFKGPENLYEKLTEKGILIRDCSNYYGLKKGFYRIAVKLPEDNDDLIYELEHLDE